MAKTIVLFSTKGGVGKTLIAVNLAVALSYYMRKNTALVNMDLHAAGDMPRLLEANPGKSFIELFNSLTSSKDFKSTIHSNAFRLEKFELDFFPGVLKPQHAGHLDAKKIKAVFDAMENSYEYIVVDAGRIFNENMFAVLNHANLILLVATPDILSVYQTKWVLDTLQSFHIPMSMIKVVLNRAESTGGVSWQEVRAALPCDIVVRIPSEGKVIGAALNRRLPFVIDSPNSKSSLAIRELSKALVENPNLFIEHQDIIAKDSGEVLSQEGDFWKRYNLAGDEASFIDQEKETDEIIELKKRINQKLIEKIDLKHLEIDLNDPLKAKEIHEKTEKIVANALTEETGVFLSSADIRRKLVKEITDEALGLGPLEDLINDNDISDIMVNNKNQIYIEKQGKLKLSPKRFISNDQVRQVIERIIAPLGRRIDESVPMVDARLKDGSRVNAIIPPLALTGPTLTIRKFGRERLNIDDLLRIGTISQAMADFVKACVLSRKNIIVSGGTGSGKTTILNILSAFIPETERIVTIEDAAEIRLKQEHWVRLESRPPNIEGKGAITVRDLFRNTLRMRPDRIIIGECRGAETLDMLQAMNTGHDGSMTTIHANSTHDVMSRMDSMILMTGSELPVRAIREMIASAINVIVHTARLSDGTRKITQISEMTGMLDDMHIGLKDVFLFKQTGLTPEGKVMGSFKPTGYIPSFFEDLKVRGIILPEEMFKVTE